MGASALLFGAGILSAGLEVRVALQDIERERQARQQEMEAYLEQLKRKYQEKLEREHPEKLE